MIVYNEPLYDKLLLVHPVFCIFVVCLSIIIMLHFLMIAGLIRYNFMSQILLFIAISVVSSCLYPGQMMFLFLLSFFFFPMDIGTG